MDHTDGKIPQAQFEALHAPVSLDLEAAYNLALDAVMKNLENSGDVETPDPEALINKILDPI